MARTRSGQDLIDDAYKRSDTEGATDRHPRTDVLRYVNQGGSELYDLLVEARGRAYYRSPTPWTFTTDANTLFYDTDFPDAFYKLIGVRIDDTFSEPLLAMQPNEEAVLSATTGMATHPSHYDLRVGGIAILPRHAAGKTIVVDYVPAFPDLDDDTDSLFDGINGWEEYVVCFAARCIAVKDEEFALAQALSQDMERLARRIAKLAPTRDANRPRRAQDVRGPRGYPRRW